MNKNMNEKHGTEEKVYLIVQRIHEELAPDSFLNDEDFVRSELEFNFSNELKAGGLTIDAAIELMDEGGALIFGSEYIRRFDMSKYRADYEFEELLWLAMTEQMDLPASPGMVKKRLFPMRQSENIIYLGIKPIF